MSKIIIVFGSLIIVASLLAYVAIDEVKMVNDVKSGALSLECDIQGKGSVVIPPSRVKDFDGERWYFDNGSAVSCAVK